MILSVALAADLDGAARAVVAGDFATAEANYREALSEGAVTADVYYNLGNVLYRQSRLPEAILAWRRAQVLAPRDPDVSANLDFARRETVDDVVVADPVPPWAPWSGALTAGEAEWLSAALVGAGLLAVALRGRAPQLPLLGVGGLGIGLGLVLGAAAGHQRALEPAVVVLVDELTARSDLGGGVDLFVLHAAAEVGVAARAAGQALVVLPDGRRGWVAEASVAPVDPFAPFPAER